MTLRTETMLGTGSEEGTSLLSNLIGGLILVEKEIGIG